MHRSLPVRMYYLEMLAPPAYPPQLRLATEIRLVRPISLRAYRDLYFQCGEDVGWIDRMLMPDEALSAILQDARVEVWVVYEEGEQAGFAEWVWQENGEMKLAYFGIIPRFRRRGLGQYFLRKTTEEAWRKSPKRLWLQTNELDHASALPGYLKAGYRIFEERIEQQIIVD